MACGIRCSRRLKICCGITAILLIILIIILVVLFLTVFKPKKPRIIVHPVTVHGFEWAVWPAPERNVSVSLGLLITIQNPNHASFSYQNSTADLNYRGKLMAQAPIYADTIPARGEHDISSILNVSVDSTKIQNLRADAGSGVVNFTSASTVYGKAKILNIIKMKATSYTTCDISVFIVSMFKSTAISTCNSEISL